MSRCVRRAAAIGGVVAAFAGSLPAPGLASVAVVAKTGTAPAELACPPEGTHAGRAPVSDPVQTAQPAVRIAFWGDSHTASGAFVDAALREWGIAPAAVQPSFIPANFAAKGVRMPLRSSCTSPAWRTRFAYVRANAAPAGFGPGLVAMESEAQGAELAWDFRWPSMATTVRSVNIHIAKREAGRSLLIGLSLDEGPEKVVAVPSTSADIVQVSGDSPFSTLRLRLVAGQAVLAGLEPAYSHAGTAVVDLFAIPGATMAGWQGVSRGLAHDYDLAVLEFGTNEAASPAFDPNAYADSLRRSLARWRSFFPRARCVLITPPDRGPAQRDQALSRRHSRVAVVQRLVSRSFGCELWDWQGWMRSAGLGALLQDDQTHLSAQGYEASGRAFAAAIPLRVR